MRSSPLAFAACFWLASLGASLAQSAYSSQDVQVNPLAGAGTSVLLYPGGEYVREAPPLLYPDETGGGAVHLHLPTRHVVSAHNEPARKAEPTHIAREKARPRTLARSSPPKTSAPPAPKAAEASPAPDNSGYSSFLGGTPNFSNVFTAPQSAAPSQQAKAAPTPPRPTPTMLAKAEPVPQHDENEGLVKRSVILFAKDAPDPARGALDSIRFLAGDLNAAMTAPSSRIELQAYGGPPGDKGSDARRLSLKRALAIRQILIDDGVSPDRIDVQAMGGTDDSGPADRVDVYVKA